MESELSSAWSLLFIGMITVFVVLFLVVLTGNFLIILVNRFSSDATNGDTPSSKIAAITGAVEIVTGGKGNIERIEKI